jgi:hypothetical protein
MREEQLGVIRVASLAAQQRKTLRFVDGTILYLRK